MTGDVRDTRDWAFGLLVRQQRLRLRLRDAGHATHERGSPELRAGAVSQTRSLAVLAATAERLCARGASVRPL
jgi:hypothetical protein